MLIIFFSYSLLYIPSSFIQRFLDLGGSVELKDLGEQRLADGSTIPLPPVVFAKIPSIPDPQKRTLGVYCHLDVQPAAKVI